MRKCCPGFTLIELLFVVSIAVLLFTIGIAKYNQFNRRQILKQTALNLKRNLHLARNRALAGKKDCPGTLDGYEFTFSSQSYSFRAKCGDNYGPATTIDFSEKTVSITSSPDSLFFKVLGQGVIIKEDGLIKDSSSVIFSGFGTTQTIEITKTGEIK